MHHTYTGNNKDAQIQNAIDRAMQRIDQSQDTYFDDLQAKEAVYKAARVAADKGHLAKALAAPTTTVVHAPTAAVVSNPVGGSSTVVHSDGLNTVSTTQSVNPPVVV